MSGDVQPRKRKEKRRKKDDLPSSEPEIISTPSKSSQNDDVNIHVHHEGGTGGGMCAKVIFFILLAVLAVLIGLILVEYRGTTEVETQKQESRFAQLFDGWVDETPHQHDDEPEIFDDHDEHSEERHDEEESQEHAVDDEEGHDGDDDEEEEDQDDNDESLEETENIDHSEEGIEETSKVSEEQQSVEEDENDDNNEDISNENNLESNENNLESNENIEKDEDDENTSEQQENDVFDQDEENASEQEEKDIFDQDEENDVSAQDDENDVSAQDDENDVSAQDDDDVSAQNQDDESAQDVEDDESAQDVEDDILMQNDESNSILEDDTGASEQDDDDNEENENEENDNIVSDEVISSEKLQILDSIEDDGPLDELNDDEGNQLDGSEEKVVDNDADEAKILEAQKKTEEEVEMETNSRNKVLPDDRAEESDSDKDEVVKPRQQPAKGGNDMDASYKFAEDTNVDDWNIADSLDAAQAYFEHNVEMALAEFSNLVLQHPTSPRALYGRAVALDRLADVRHSNKLLQEAILGYKLVLNNGKNIPDSLFLKTAERCIDRMRFKGDYLSAVDVHKQLIAKFPNKPSYRNQLAVTYLMINRLPMAKHVLHETLLQWPDNGFAQVHYGFVLKTGANDMERGARYLHDGIRSGEPGTQDGRFFFHLGDAYMRMGRIADAYQVYDDGVKQGLFLSRYQRSLYNVNRLTGRPWWTPEQTGYADFFTFLEKNWEIIRNEGLALLNSGGLFKDEAENLKDIGDWKQFELFARGEKLEKNCKRAPLTCKLIEKFSPASHCHRGQVKFSVMHPNTHVWAHCGPTNCRLRAHLGLKIPNGTSIRVAEDTKTWEEGKIIIFDDSFEHEVWHNGTEIRLVLIVDVWHPELTVKEKSMLPAI